MLMSSTEGRLRALINDNLDLDHDPDFNARFSDVGVSSVDAIAFFKLLNQEFDLGMVAEECTQFDTLRDIVNFIDARSG